MSDTSVTLPQSAIPLVGFLPAGICYLWVSRFGPVWTREGLPAEETPTLKSAITLRKSNLVIRGSMKLYHWNSLMDAPSNWALAYNPSSTKSLHIPSSATLTSLSGPPLTYPTLTFKSHPTNSPFTRMPDMSPRRNESFVTHVD